MRLEACLAPLEGEGDDVALQPLRAHAGEGAELGVRVARDGRRQQRGGDEAGADHAGTSSPAVRSRPSSPAASAAG